MSKTKQIEETEIEKLIAVLVNAQRKLDGVVNNLVEGNSEQAFSCLRDAEHLIDDAQQALHEKLYR